MRYNTPVFFVKEESKRYDPDAGEWLGGSIDRRKKYANVTHMGAERQQVAFGDVRADRFIVRLQRAYTKAYDCIEFDGKRYSVDVERCPSDKRSLVVAENGRD